jgi:hypothetical protein
MKNINDIRYDNCSLLEGVSPIREQYLSRQFKVTNLRTNVHTVSNYISYYLVLYSQIIYLLYILSWPPIYYLCSHVYFLLFIFPHGFIYDIIILVEDQLSPICFLVFVRLFLCNPIHPFKRLIILNVTNRLALDGNMNIFYVHARMREPL